MFTLILSFCMYGDAAPCNHFNSGNYASQWECEWMRKHYDAELGQQYRTKCVRMVDSGGNSR